MSVGGFREIDANAHEAQRRFYNRGGQAWEPACVDMPFDEMLALEDDGQDGAPGDYEMNQRRLGVMAFFKFIKARGVTPMDMFRQLTAVARAMHIAPFHAMTMHEVAMMEGQSPAAHSWRCNLLSGLIELEGMRGSRLPGQKTKAARESYKRCRKGNQNRLGGKKVTEPQRAVRQGSFLRSLHVEKRKAARAEHPISDVQHCPHAAADFSPRLESTPNPE